MVLKAESTAEGGQPEEEQEVSLHDALAAAFDQVEAGDGEGAESATGTPAEGEAPAEGAAEGTPEEQEAAAQRARDEKGRFKEGEKAAKTAARAVKIAKAGEQQEQLTPEQQATKDAAATAEAAKSLEAPANWSAPDKAMLADLQKLSPRGAQWLLDRHKAMEADHTRKTQAIAAFSKEYGPVNEMFVPWRDRMQAAGYTPQTLIKAWASVEQDLMSGDTAKQIGVLSRMVDMYKLPKDQIAQALGLSAAPTAKDPAAAAAAAADPASREIPAHMVPWVQELAELRNWKKTVDTRFQTREQQEQQQLQAHTTAEYERIGSEIETFRTAVDKDGKTLLHPHFDEVERDMSLLAQVARARGTPKTIQQLYEDAVWANPSVRAKQLAADQSAQQAKAQTEARAKAAQARRAGSSVTGAPSSGQTPRTAPAGQEVSLRSALEAAYEDQANQ